MRSPLTLVLLAVLRVYRRVVSPLYGPVCRYHPSCSAYALRAVDTHGGIKGSWLAARRLARCHPWAEGGVDPVPVAGAYRWWGRVPLDDDGVPLGAADVAPADLAPADVPPADVPDAAVGPAPRPAPPTAA